MTWKQLKDKIWCKMSLKKQVGRFATKKQKTKKKKKQPCPDCLFNIIEMTNLYCLAVGKGIPLLVCSLMIENFIKPVEPIPVKMTS